MSNKNTYGVYTIKNNESEENVDFNYSRTLKMSEKISFVNNVVGLVVDDRNYNSIVEDMMFDYMLIVTFTNVDTSSIDTTDAIEDFLNNTNIVDILKKNTEIGLVDELHNAVDKAIEYKTGIHKNMFSDSINSLLKTIESKIENTDISGIVEMAKKINSITSPITPENMLKAYANTDMFLENKTKRRTAKSKTTK